MAKDLRIYASGRRKEAVARVFLSPGNGRISVTLAADGDAAVLSVQDTGAGIEAAFLPHVFDQFRQGEGGLSRKHGGLGLGLAVVKQLIELHDGTVDVGSPGAAHGTTFTVRLPAIRCCSMTSPSGS